MILVCLSSFMIGFIRPLGDVERNSATEKSQVKSTWQFVFLPRMYWQLGKWKSKRFGFIAIGQSETHVKGIHLVCSQLFEIVMQKGKHKTRKYTPNRTHAHAQQHTNTHRRNKLRVSVVDPFTFA